MPGTLQRWLSHMDLHFRARKYFTEFPSGTYCKFLGLQLHHVQAQADRWPEEGVALIGLY